MNSVSGQSSCDVICCCGMLEKKCIRQYLETWGHVVSDVELWSSTSADLTLNHNPWLVVRGILKLGSVVLPDLRFEPDGCSGGCSEPLFLFSMPTILCCWRTQGAILPLFVEQTKLRQLMAVQYNLTRVLTQFVSERESWQLFKLPKQNIFSFFAIRVASNG